MTARGFTLTELVVASTLALIVVVGVGRMDVTRARMREIAREINGISTPSRADAAIAMLHISKETVGADRVVIDDPNGIYLFRIPLLKYDAGVCTNCASNTPPECCLDNPQNYRWVEYRWDRNTFTLNFYDDIAAGCPAAARVLAKGVSGFDMWFYDSEPLSPVNGGPALNSSDNTNTKETQADNNVVHYLLDWEDTTFNRILNSATAGHQHVFEDQVTIRSAPYSDVNVNCPADNVRAPCDSGTGLTKAGVSDPPAPCVN